MFISPDGGQLRANNLRRREWAEAVRLAGLDPAPTFHDMRHTAVSLWVASAKGKQRQANVTDPDSRMLRARNRFLQGYNAQAAVSEDQVIGAAEVTNAANGSTMFVPLVAATEANLDAAGRAEAVGAYAADAGYWSVPNATLATDAEILIGPMPATQGITDPDDPRIRSAMKCWAP